MIEGRWFTEKLNKNVDILTAIAMIGIIAMIILPIKSYVLDLLLTINITLAIMILLLTLFTGDILEFSAFPTLLLITTLFRLGLNISSTRLILSEGKAGNIIDAFGGFVTGDNYIVGAIIFIIIVVIQFVVITNGAGRVAEVAARFTLDAMPGKQMSIDADLNAGVINDEVARNRRNNLQRETDFYGSMDGASKFVKGDAIAGIVIVIINFLGGIAIFSWQKGVPIGEAIQDFGVLTIGDGLVSQIPALLISIASGILVTRSAGEDSFGNEITRQLFTNPKVLGITAGALVLLGLIPALPNIPFLILALGCGGLAYFLNEEQKQNKMDITVKNEKSEKETAKEPEDVMKYIGVETIEIEIGYGLIPLVESSKGGDLLDRIAAIRKENALNMGIVVQPIRIRDNLQIYADEYIIRIRGNEIAKGSVIYNHFLIMDTNGEAIKLKGKATVEPVFGLPAVWIQKDEKDKAEMMGYTIVDPTTVMVTHLSDVIKRYSHELLGRSEVKKLLENISENYSAVTEELIPEIMSIGDVQKVLQNLLKERVVIRDLVSILETLADYAGNIKDVEILTEYVRHRLGRTITSQYINKDRILEVITIDSTLEQHLSENIQKSFQGSFLVIDPELNEKILDNMKEILEAASNIGKNPVMLVSPRIRLVFRKFIEMIYPDLAILSLNEIPNTIELEGIGMVSVSDS